MVLVVGIRIGHKVVLNKLEQTMGLVFASLNMFFFDLNISLSVVVAGVLDDGTIARCHQLNFIRDLLNFVRNGIPFNQAVAIVKVIFVNSLNLVLHIAVFTPCQMKMK
ncbi:hypothetical protein ACFX2G_022231 [Malus domestica]